MFLRVIVLIAYSVLVSAHSGAPAISAQTYPIYQQNGFANPYPNQPHEITPYQQTYTTQNQTPQPNEYPSIIRQVLLNKFLSNSPTQTNLDPNIRSCDLNFDGYQNNQIPPNLLNKYLVPSQYLNTNDVNREEIDEKKTKEKSKRNRKKSSNKKRKHEAKDNTETSISKLKDSQLTVSNTETQRTSGRKSRKTKTRHSEQENERKVEEKSNTRGTKKRKHKEDKQTENQPNDEVNKVEIPKKKKRRRRKKPKLDLDNTIKVAAEENLTLKQMKEGFNLAQSSGREENRVVRNPQVEANETNPSTKVPEDVASTFLTKLPAFDNPTMSNFFTNYENFYQSLVNNMTVTDKKPQIIEMRKPKRTRNNNNNRKRNNQHNKTSTQEITVTNPKIKLKIDAVTTEKTVQVPEKVQPNIDSKNNTEGIKSNDETKVDKESSTSLPDENLNSQDLDESINFPYDGYIDDYYPQFTDNAYNANNNENYVKIIDGDQYYYATDKEIKRLNYGSSLPERNIKDYEMNKQYDDIEDTLLKIDDTDNEIEFKSPPLLEKPDFETRPISKSDKRPEVYYKKDDTTHRFVGDKSIEIKPQQKINFVKPPKDLETVYARSKVVKYGSARSSEERTFKNDWSETFQDGGTTYVFAKSLDHPDEYWSVK